MPDSLDRARSHWLDLALDTVGSFDSVIPWGSICRELGRQLDSPVTGEFSWDKLGRGIVNAHPMPNWFDLPQVAARAPELHPIARRYASDHDVTVMSMSDVISPSEASVREYVAELGEHRIGQHLWIPVTYQGSGPHVIGVCRDKDDYTVSERAHAELAQRVVVALHRHQVTMSRLRGGASDRPLNSVVAATSLRLTSRQAAVLCLAAEGLTSRAIGRRLLLSPRTVERHLQNAYTRLQVHDRVTAIRRAEAAGLFTTFGDD